MSPYRAKPVSKKKLPLDLLFTTEKKQKSITLARSVVAVLRLLFVSFSTSALARSHNCHLYYNTIGTPQHQCGAGIG